MAICHGRDAGARRLAARCSRMRLCILVPKPTHFLSVRITLSTVEDNSPYARELPVSRVQLGVTLRSPRRVEFATTVHMRTAAQVHNGC
jgi:hypothetical protein